MPSQCILGGGVQGRGNIKPQIANKSNRHTYIQTGRISLADRYTYRQNETDRACRHIYRHTDRLTDQKEPQTKTYRQNEPERAEIHIYRQTDRHTDQKEPQIKTERQNEPD